MTNTSTGTEQDSEKVIQQAKTGKNLTQSIQTEEKDLDTRALIDAAIKAKEESRDIEAESLLIRAIEKDPENRLALKNTYRDNSIKKITRQHLEKLKELK